MKKDSKMPTREEAEDAIRTLIKWIGEDDAREGLKDTPRRVIDSFAEFFSGYHDNAEEILATEFEETSEYDDMVLLKNIAFVSHCEHHMLPVIGTANIAYYPKNKVIGISKIARIVDMYAKRMQLQERMTAEIAKDLDKYLDTRGVIVSISAKHQCMTIRGVNKSDAFVNTIYATGVFKDNFPERAKFENYIK